eukprot:TRINITY_DN4868_c0_g1_i3.p1 TRINITY_DN4868_c0_g1~~TRINITY_DN4868_c0_g1_i3.p1  ORF type:complete len:841 (+),score=226.05 TRINITY_DN4868_c0_g1_i3:121-2643(+)
MAEVKKKPSGKKAGAKKGRTAEDVDKIKMVLIGDKWEDQKVVADSIIVVAPRADPIQQSAGAICKKLGVESLAGLTFSVAAGGKPSKPLDLSAPPPVDPQKKSIKLYVQCAAGGSPAEAVPPPKAPKPAGKAKKAPAKADVPKTAPAEGGSSAEATLAPSPRAAAEVVPASPDPPAPAAVQPPPSAGAPHPQLLVAHTPPPASPQSPSQPISPILFQIAGLSNSPIKAEHRQRLVSFYSAHNPAKLGDVEAILRAWEGEEDLLFCRLSDRYVRPQEERRREEERQRQQALERAAELDRSRERDAQATAAMGAAQAAAAAAVDAIEQRRGLAFDEERRLHERVRAQLQAAEGELAALRRQQSSERGSREALQRREGAEQLAAAAREREEHLAESLRLAQAAREREHQQRLRAEALGRREQELRAREADAALHQQQQAADEAARLGQREAEAALLRAHADALLRAAAAPAAPGAPARLAPSPPPPLQPSVEGPLSEARQEHAALRADIGELRRAIGDISRLPYGARSPPTGEQPCAELAGSGGAAAEGSPERAGSWAAEFTAVGEALRRAGLLQYAALFAGQDFDEMAFAAVTDADLRELGVSSVGARKRLLREAAEMAGRLAVAPLSFPPPPEPSPPVPVAPAPGLEALLAGGPPDQSAAPLPPHELAADPVLGFHLATVCDFYAAADPAKLPAAPAIVAQHAARGALAELYSALVSIYRLGSSPCVPKVRMLCRRVCPAREPATEVLCWLSRGREAELMCGLQAAGGAEPAGDWCELRDEAGRPYWYSPAAGEAQWLRPRGLGSSRAPPTEGAGLLAPSAAQLCSGPPLPTAALPPPRLW